MQNLRSEISWPGLLKCSATGNPREFCLTECKWLLKRNLNLVLVSPMYQECGHFVQYKAYTTFAELQLKLPGRITHWFMVTVSSVSMRLHILHCGLLQGLLDWVVVRLCVVLTWLRTSDFLRLGGCFLAYTGGRVKTFVRWGSACKVRKLCWKDFTRGSKFGWNIVTRGMRELGGFVL